TKARKRVGRGIGSGKGKTAGRGVKGQKSRSGVSINGFEGGQMPIHMRLPKRGFTSRNKKQHAWVNLGILSKAIEAGKLDAKSEITEDALVEAGVVRRVKDGVRLLAKGDAPKKVNITVTGASKAAIAAIEKAGGKVTVTAPAEDAAAD
ncbi:MAG: 50S ribosomal protein L15, partial [Pseudomonadota bacterium]